MGWDHPGNDSFSELSGKCFLHLFLGSSYTGMQEVKPGTFYHMHDVKSTHNVCIWQYMPSALKLVDFFN